MLATCGWWGRMPIQDFSFGLKALWDLIWSLIFIYCFFEGFFQVPPSLKIHNAISATQGRFHWRHLLQYPQAIVPWSHCYQSAITFCGSWPCVAEPGGNLELLTNSRTVHQNAFWVSRVGLILLKHVQNNRDMHAYNCIILHIYDLEFKLSETPCKRNNMYTIKRSKSSGLWPASSLGAISRPTRHILKKSYWGWIWLNHLLRTLWVRMAR